MRKYFVLFIYNFLLIALVFYIYFISSNNVKMYNVPDLSNLKDTVGIELLKDFDIAIEYVESDVNKDTILYTFPKANQLIFKDQRIIIYVSSGNKAKYKNLTNQIYVDCQDYLNKIKEEYSLKIVTKYIEDSKYPNGLIIKQITPNKYLNSGDLVELVIIKNENTVKIPNFFGWKDIDVVKYCNENKINVELEYIEFLFEANCVVAQSVKEKELVIKQGNPIIIYLAKES